MSVLKLPIRYAEEARQDIRDILVYTVRRWGKQQRTICRAALDDAFATIRNNPDIGKPRDDLMATHADSSFGNISFFTPSMTWSSLCSASYIRAWISPPSSTDN
jgi:plasmid stabilization system protein ParE